MIAFDEALALIAATARPLGEETVAVRDAAGRVLAKPVRAEVDSPPADASAMDGYAVRSADLELLPARLTLVSENFAGTPEPGSIAPGECARIFTGGPIPHGADRIVIQEEVKREGSEALFTQALSANRHVRERANDFARGDQLLATGSLLGPRQLVAAAAADAGEVTCWRRPQVELLVTGDELEEPGFARHRRGAIPESVSVGLAAMVEQFGGQVTATTRVADDLAALEGAAAQAVGRSDLVLVSGGASVGERDFAKLMFRPLGLDLIFDKVAIRPGKPVWLGRVKGKLALGLPGNPTSALVTARLFLAPLLSQMVGRDPGTALDWQTRKLGGAIAATGARETFVRARLGSDGAAHPLGNQHSSAQHALAEADLLVRCAPGSAAMAEGAEVETLAF